LLPPLPCHFVASHPLYFSLKRSGTRGEEIFLFFIASCGQRATSGGRNPYLYGSAETYRLRLATVSLFMARCRAVMDV
jgi:hypothetical protein